MPCLAVAFLQNLDLQLPFPGTCPFLRGVEAKAQLLSLHLRNDSRFIDYEGLRLFLLKTLPHLGTLESLLVLYCHEAQDTMNLVMVAAKHCKRLCNLMLWDCDGVTEVLDRLVLDPTFCTHLKSLEIMPYDDGWPTEGRHRYPIAQLCIALRRLRPLLNVLQPREENPLACPLAHSTRYGGLPACRRIQSEAEEIM